MAAKMSDAELSRKAGRLINTRRAKNKLKHIASELSGQIIDEMNCRGITEYSAPKGNLTKYETTPRSMSASDLFDAIGPASINVMRVDVAAAVEMFGEKVLASILKEGTLQEKVLTKPAQKPGKVQVRVP